MEDVHFFHSVDKVDNFSKIYRCFEFCVWLLILLQPCHLASTLISFFYDFPKINSLQFLHCAFGLFQQVYEGCPFFHIAIKLAKNLTVLPRFDSE
nr:uncharacterized protein LOC104645091 isoform X3 [Solanum lycopersicum]